MLKWRTILSTGPTRLVLRSSIVSQANNVHTGSCQCSSNREAKIMSKLVFGTIRTAKKSWQKEKTEIEKFTASPNIKFESLGFSRGGGGGKKNFRRQNVLNKLFMQHITDQMSNDETINNRGIQITQVKVASDYKCVNIFWMCDFVAQKMHETAGALNKYSYRLRHNLSDLRLMGEVPVINFVFDKQLASGLYVDQLLKTADLGSDEDHSEDELTVEGATHEEDMNIMQPPMRNDVYDLDHDAIMSSVKISIKKSKKLQCEVNAVGDLLNSWQKAKNPSSDFMAKNSDRIKLLLKKRERRNKDTAWMPTPHGDYEDEVEAYEEDSDFYIEDPEPHQSR